MTDVFDANISHAFYYPTAAFDTAQAFASAVKTSFPGVVEYDLRGTYPQAHIRDLQTAQRFLHGGAQTYDTCRFFLENLRPDLERAGFTDWCAMISYFPESNVMCVSFHYGLADICCDKLIVLRQSGQYRRYPFAQGERSCAELAEEICSRLGVRGAAVEQSYLCELTRFGAYEDMDQIEQEQANRIYGLLTGDEAYSFVPEQVVRSRLKYTWGSRSFIRIYAYGQAFVFLNLIGSGKRAAYLAHQEAFGTAAYGACDAYFHMGSCPLSVNHGILFSVEFVMMLKTLIDEVISYQGEYSRNRRTSFYKRIQETREFRRKIIIALEKTENTVISEIGELSAVLLESQNIAPIVDQVKYLLELLESDLDLMYSERNNILVTFLTILGLVFAALQIVIPFL